MLTKRKLLAARYRVIVSFPDGPPVGTLIQGTRFKIWGENSVAVYLCRKYPAVFEPLDWWEFRRTDEMPEKVKDANGKVFKVLRWTEGVETENGIQPMRMQLKGEVGDWQVIANVMCFYSPV